MEDIVSHHQSTSPSQITRMRPNVKLYLEKWYQAKGKPKVVTHAEKASVIHVIKSEIDPVGVTVRQLNRWLARRRCLEGDLGASRLKQSSVGILFPMLTNTEIDHLKFLVGENPNPSSDLVMLWVDSPLLPNLTVDDAHRFVRYNKLQVQTDIQPTALTSALLQDNSGDTDQSDEEETFDNCIDFPTPESTPPDSNPKTLTLDSNIPPKLQNQADYSIDGTSPMSSATTIQLPHDPRALLALLRSQLSTDELEQLLQEGSNNKPPMSPTSLPAEPLVSINRASSKSPLLSPISPLSHKPLFTQARSACPGESAGLSDLPGKLPWIDSSPHPNNTSDSMKEPTTTSLGVISRKILRDMSRLWLVTTPYCSSSDEPIERLELCQKRSEEWIVALERGDLKKFGIFPTKESKAFECSGSVGVLSDDASSSMDTNCVTW